MTLGMKSIPQKGNSPHIHGELRLEPISRDTDKNNNNIRTMPSPATTQNTSNPNSIFREVNIEDEFEIVKTLAEGSFAKVLLAKKSTEKMVLKAIHCEVSSEEDFSRELHYNYFLSPHPNIVTSFNVSFIWDNCFVFVQEFAPLGDLSRFVKKGGLPETRVKAVAAQLAAALDFMHGLHLVHRDLKLENILVFKQSLSQIKLCDFGYTRAEGVLVTRTNQTWIQFSPPEIQRIVLQEKYYCQTSSDVWQVGIILYVCLAGFAPWQIADITDTQFCQYTDWHRRKLIRLPNTFIGFSARLLRLFKRLLEPKAWKRCEVREINKYLKDDWFRKSSSGGNSISGENCMNSNTLQRKDTMKTSKSSQRLRTARFDTTRHSRHKSCKTLRNYGLETEIDKNLISERVVNWISNSSTSLGSSFNSEDDGII